METLFSVLLSWHNNPNDRRTSYLLVIGNMPIGFNESFSQWQSLGYWAKSICVTKYTFVELLVLCIDIWFQVHITSCILHCSFSEMPQWLRHCPCIWQHHQNYYLWMVALVLVPVNFMGMNSLWHSHFFQSYSQDTGHLADSTSFCPWSIA